MKRSEFIKKVNGLGLSAGIFLDGNMVVYHNEGIIVSINEKVPCNILTNIKHIESFTEELFNICTEYAKTPIEEREDEEKFYLQKIESFYDENYDEENAYLNFEMSDGDFLLESINENNAYKTQFTQKEIDKIKEEQHTDLSEFKQIPVEEIEA